MKLTLALTAAALLAAQAASASTHNLSYIGGAPGYRVVGIETTAVDVAGGALNVYAGGFKMTDSVAGGLGDFIAWCLDLGAYLGTSGSHEYKTTETAFQNGGVDLMAAGMARISSVFDANFGAGVTATKDSSAAFQLALWESVYDDDFSISSGSFKATASAEVEALASGYLTAAANYMGPSTWNLSYLESTATSRRQNLVTAVDQTSNEPEPVPLPASALLLLTAVGGLGAAARRRKTK